MLNFKEPVESVRVDRLLSQEKKIDGWSWSLIRSNTPRIALMERAELDMMPIDDMKKPNLALQQTHASLMHTIAPGVDTFILIHPEVSRFIDQDVSQKIHPTVFWKMYPEGPPKNKKKKRRSLREEPEVNSPETEAQASQGGNATPAAQPQSSQQPARSQATQQQPVPARNRPAAAEAQSSQTVAVQFHAPVEDNPAEEYGNLGASADRGMWPPGFRAFSREPRGGTRPAAQPAADARKRPSGDAATSNDSARKRSKNRDVEREVSADSWRRDRKEKLTARNCWKIAKKRFRQFNQRHGQKIIDYLQFALDTVAAPVIGSYTFCTQGYWPQGLFPTWPRYALGSDNSEFLFLWVSSYCVLCSSPWKWESNYWCERFVL